MTKKSTETKVVEQLASALDNHWFNPAIFANVIVNNYTLYTQDKLTDLMSEIIKAQAVRFTDEWENGNTSAGLMLSSHLAEVIQMHEPLE